MDEPSVTFGALLGLEIEGEGDVRAGDSARTFLLVFCPTGESDPGNINVTPRMMDLAIMRFRPVAVARWNSQDTRYYAIFAKGGSQIRSEMRIEQSRQLDSECIVRFRTLELQFDRKQQH